MKIFVDNLVEGEGFMGKVEGRLYGIGAALDVAGLRFSAVLTMISFFCIHNRYSNRFVIFYLVAFFIIAIIGSMISRTTIVGITIAIIYWINAAIHSTRTERQNAIFWRYLTWSAIGAIPIIIILYNYNNVFHEQFRFGFEGFFSLYEKGVWETNSNNILKNMIIFPDNLETWIIGDGYIVKPELVDPYYIGTQYHGFYKDTDIGYILFLFYFGIIGVLSMITYIVKTALVCIEKHPSYRTIFVMLLIVNLIGWCKVTTDIFVAFAPFLVLSSANGNNTSISES